MLNAGKDQAQELVDNLHCEKCGTLVRKPTRLENWFMGLYVGSRFMNIISLFLFLGLFIYSLSLSEKYQVAAYEMGNVALAQNLTNYNATSVQMFSLTPIVCAAMLMINILILR